MQPRIVMAVIAVFALLIAAVASAIPANAQDPAPTVRVSRSSGTITEGGTTPARFTIRVSPRPAPGETVTVDVDIAVTPFDTITTNRRGRVGSGQQQCEVSDTEVVEVYSTSPVDADCADFDIVAMRQLRGAESSTPLGIGMMLNDDGEASVEVQIDSSGEIVLSFDVMDDGFGIGNGDITVTLPTDDASTYEVRGSNTQTVNIRERGWPSGTVQVRLGNDESQTSASYQARFARFENLRENCGWGKPLQNSGGTDYECYFISHMDDSGVHAQTLVAVPIVNPVILTDEQVAAQIEADARRIAALPARRPNPVSNVSIPNKLVLLPLPVDPQEACAALPTTGGVRGRCFAEVITTPAYASYLAQVDRITTENARRSEIANPPLSYREGTEYHAAQLALHHEARDAGTVPRTRTLKRITTPGLPPAIPPGGLCNDGDYSESDCDRIIETFDREWEQWEADHTRYEQEIEELWDSQQPFLHCQNEDIASQYDWRDLDGHRCNIEEALVPDPPTP